MKDHWILMREPNSLNSFPGGSPDCKLSKEESILMATEKRYHTLLDPFQTGSEKVKASSALLRDPSVAKIVEETIVEACITVAAGEEWPLTTRIIYVGGVQTLR